MLSGSWKTSAIGVLAGVTSYLAALGPNLPTTGAEWCTVMVAALLAALGIGAKDANISNSPVPGPAQTVK